MDLGNDDMLLDEPHPKHFRLHLTIFMLALQNLGVHYDMVSACEDAAE